MRDLWIALLGLAAVPAMALIDPRFTPADLVRGSQQVLAIKLSAGTGKAMTAEVLETIRGTAPAEGKVTLAVDPDLWASAGDAASLAGNGIMVMAATETVDPAKDPVGVVLVGEKWLGLFKRDGQLVLVPDSRELGRIWAGNGINLAAAARYIQSEPAAYFPVRSDLVWGRDESLGKLESQPQGCLPSPEGAILLSEGGDWLIKAGGKQKLPTASKRATWAVMAANSRPDFVSWTGKKLVVGGKALAELSECLSLDAADIGILIAGTRTQPLQVTADGKVATLPGEPNKDMGAGGLCVVADIDRDGKPDVVQMFSKGMAIYGGEGGGRFKAPVKVAVQLPEQPCAAICGDFDTDGSLDLLVGGDGGMALLSRDDKQQWQNQARVTGELVYHGAGNSPKVIQVSATDINGDGRQGVALFYADRKPMQFFNRGFACFGWARELDSTDGEAQMRGAEETQPKPALPGPKALQEGQTCGTMLDLDGDKAPDLIGVTAATREVWVLYGANQASPQLRTLSVSSPVPVTITVKDKRVAGMYVARPGQPAVIARPGAGPVTLEWVDATGKLTSRKVVVVKPLTEVTIP